MNEENIKKARNSIKYWNRVNIVSCIVLMWLPWVWKTYLSEYLNQKYWYTILSWESITYTIFGTEKCSWYQYKEAYEILNYLAIEILKDWYKIVIDWTNLKFAFRTQIYNSLKLLNIIITGIYLYVNDKISLERLELRWEDYSNSQKIISKCSKETYNSFKEQLELPNNEENFHILESNNDLFNEVDKIINSL